MSDHWKPQLTNGSDWWCTVSPGEAQPGSRHPDGEAIELTARQAAASNPKDRTKARQATSRERSLARRGLTMTSLNCGRGCAAGPAQCRAAPVRAFQEFP